MNGQLQMLDEPNDCAAPSAKQEPESNSEIINSIIRQDT